MSPCHCLEIMWALRRRNTRTDSDFVVRFLQPSVKRPQTEKMRSTKACDAGALIRSCAKGASRGYIGIRCSQNCNGSDQWNLTFSWKRLKLGPESLHTQAKTICILFTILVLHIIFVRLLVLVHENTTAPKSTFLTTSQLNGKFNGLYLRNKTWYA